MAILLMPLSAHAAEVVYDRILVKINDDIITQYDLDEEMKPILAKVNVKGLSASQKEQLKELSKQTLEKMINDKLMAQEIKKYGIDVPDKAVDDEIDKIKQERNLTDEQFAAMVKADDLTVPEFRVRMKGLIEKQELLGYMVHSKVLVTDSEIKKEYEAHRDDYLLEKMVELGIILLPPDISAVEVRKRIQDGEMTFAEAAAKYSVGPGKDKGGSIGEMDWGDLADDWKQSIDGVPVGGVGQPLQVQGKEALLSPIKIVEDRLVPLDDVKDDISNRLMQKKREAIFKDYFDKLKQSSVIEYMQ
ncbi:SurA N-terminal domain-containing protein [Pseudodesulfovibrio sp.]|uniref:SurA N-terminal domain-containing protein n=1 Tax=Pseudodesulfovibrio sp. TaxID=2035812 RepID=UPI0026393CE7|nr:SurA N-terminal domain-containing protein [Pseudodesulfovibrio sp.]MDD3313087.1 SurA N-terminal domain-containing protein [Pseudodesulfovibrio sp.]